jgi:hypothetical protein
MNPILRLCSWNARDRICLDCYKTLLEGLCPRCEVVCCPEEKEVDVGVSDSSTAGDMLRFSSRRPLEVTPRGRSFAIKPSWDSYKMLVVQV